MSFSRSSLYRVTEKKQRNLSLIVITGNSPWSGYMQGNHWLGCFWESVSSGTSVSSEQPGWTITGNYYCRILTNISIILLGIVMSGYRYVYSNYYCRILTNISIILLGIVRSGYRYVYRYLARCITSIHIYMYTNYILLR